MLSLKKYFTEGLIQVAILLSMCGVRLDVGFESYLPPSLHEMIHGPTSLLTQTQFHNLRNRLEDGQDLHPKSVDLDEYFYRQRLRSWMCSLDRLQIPQQEVVTWLVQQEPELPAHISRAAAGEREHSLRGAVVHSEAEEEMESEERSTSEQQGSGHDDQARPGRGQSSAVQRQSDQQEMNQTSLQECLRLLEVTFPFSEEVRDVNADLPHCSPPPHMDSSTSELDHQWQDLLAILTPESIHPGFEPDTGHEIAAASDPFIRYKETPETQGFPQDQQPGLLPLVPSAELDDHSSTHERRAASVTHTPPDHMGLLSEDPPLSTEDPFSSFSMDLLPPGIDEHMSCLQLDSSSSASTSSSAEEQDVAAEADFDDLLQDASILDEMGYLDLDMDDGFSPEIVGDCFNTEEKDDVQSSSSATPEQTPALHPQPEAENELDSDSGLSLDFSNSPSSPCVSSASSRISSSSSSSSSSSMSPYGDTGSEEEFDSTDMEVEVTIKQEQEEEEIGAVGGEYPEDVKFFSTNLGDSKILAPCLDQWIGHDHTYNQPLGSNSPPPTLPTKPSRSFRQSPDSRFYHKALSRHHDIKMRSRDERQARALKIPFSIELIVHLPVEEFNDLLTDYLLTEDQLTIVRDIRRRGKNKIAAQNCRQRKLGVLQDLEGEVTALQRRRLQLLRERQEALRNLQDLKRELGTLHWEVFSGLRDEEGRPLDSSEYQLQVGPDGTVTVDPLTRKVKQSSMCRKASKKQKKK